MKSEHLMTVDITSASIRKISIPKGGAVIGVYASAPISIAYNDNGTVGTLLTNVSTWEPHIPFLPAAIAYLEITTTAAVKVAIRYVA